MTKIKKALLSIVCCFAVIFCCAFVFTACTSAKYTSYDITIDKAIQRDWIKVPGDAIVGEEITIVLTPDEGYELVPGSLKVNDKAIDGNKFIMPNKNVSITAEFRKITYSISKSNCEHGSFTVPEFANYQDVIKLESAPDVGYELDQILVDGKAISGNSFTMPAKDVVVSVSFRAIDYSITVNLSENGSIVPDKTTANVGDQITLTVNPDATYKLENLIIKNGDSLVAGQTNGNTVTFTMPAGNVTISATFAQNVNAVNINPTENGNVSATPVNALEGAEVVLTVSPATGYKLKSLKVMFGETEIAVVDNKFTMPAGSVTISATFEIIDYQITEKGTANGSFTVSKTTANYNDEITITVTPNTGYEIDQILVDGNPITETTFKMPAKDVTVKVTFKAINYTILVDENIENDLVSVDQTIANMGNEITITVNPEVGYAVDSVYVTYKDENGEEKRITANLTSVENEYSFIMPAGDVTVSVTFKVINYTITKNITGDGVVNVKDTATYGENVTVTATANTGYELDQILVDGVALEVGVTSFTMPANNVAVSVTFKKINYTITKNSTTNGSFTVSKATANYNDEITITVSPATGYELDQILVDGEAISGTSFTMPANNVAVKVTFKKINYTITKNSPTNGSFNVKETATYGETVTITVTPATGYELDQILVDGVALEVGVTSFTMPANNVAVSVTFKAINYTITKNSTTNGSFTVSKTTANYNDEITITVTPATGYELDQILVDGKEITGTTFTMPANNVAVSVTFKAINYTITKNSTTNGSFNVKETATYGETVTITVTPATGYELDQILVDGKAISGNSFTMPANNVAVSVTFKAINYTITKNSTTNGSFDVKGTAKTDETVTITATPSTNYVVREVKINGSSTGVTKVSDTVYTFVMPANSVQVKVEFGYYLLTVNDIEYTASGTDLTVTKVITDKTHYEIPSIFNISGKDYTVINIGNTNECIDSDVICLILPNTIKNIKDNAFWLCEKLSSITIPEGTTSIGKVAFCGCTDLISITIPSSVTSIGDYAFQSCTGLTSITIPENVTSIGNSAFHNCKKLSSITIPEGVTSIGNSAFEGCTGLTSITIPNSVTSIGDLAFYQCTGLTSITIPSSVTGIGEYAFSGCTGLTSITIPNSITSISNGAFSGCTGLISIIIPISVVGIGNYAFEECTGLTSIIFSSATPPTLGLNSFSDSSSLEKVYVPAGSKAAYRTALGTALGSGFARIVYENLISAPRSFDGTEFVNLGRDYMYQDTLTVEVMAYMDDWSKYTTNMRLISCTEGGGWNVGEVLGGKIHFSCYDSGNGYKNVTTSMTFADLSAGWHTFKITFDGEYLRAYIDGQLVGTSEKYVSGKIGYASNSIFVGAEAGSSATTPIFSSGNFKGKIAYVRIENNVS
ncbi:MAG: leucine-rich repeat protein [Firmicutes bacterium]|nr:leucine-rich repeat protein [Bacillota bacterium]